MSVLTISWPPATVGLLARCTFPPAGEAVTCAVSGGADSLALLALAIAAGCPVHAVHIDHGIRPGSDREADVVAEAAASVGATFEALRAHVAPGPDLEARARRERYRLLPAGVLTGHTADDQAETLLINLMRGCGLEGLAPLMAVHGGLAGASRPIVALRRAETAALVASLGWATVTDPSNADPRFWRNRARHELLPLMASVSGRDPVPLLARTARLLAADAEYLAAQAAALDATNVRLLLAAPRPVAQRALRQWLRLHQGEEHYPPSEAEMGRVWRVVAGEVKACELSGGRRLSRSKGRLYLGPSDIG